jgi:hypothetical protein
MPKDEFPVAKTYYYMWSYNTEGDDGWGENTIDLKFDATKHLNWVKDTVFRIVSEMDGDFSTLFGDKPRKRDYSKFSVMVEEKSNDPHSLQNQDVIQKAKIGYKIP